MNENIVVRWCDDVGRVPELVAFFRTHAPTSYISHGEIMDGRALDRHTWSKALPRILADEFGLSEFSSRPSRPVGKRIVLAEAAGSLIGFALVELGGAEAARHAVLHDLVVSTTRRGSGTGARMLAWLEAELGAEQVRFIFLESGIENESAHRFFARLGYEPSSLTMMKSLDGPDQ